MMSGLNLFRSFLGLSVAFGIYGIGQHYIMASAETNRAVIASPVEADLFIDLLNAPNERSVDRAIRKVRSNWTPALMPQLLEIATNTRSEYSRDKIFDLLSKRTGKRYGRNVNRWYDYLWSQDEQITDDYGAFKAFLYESVDPRFVAYFQDRQESALIRLDEIRWGGVQQDGIPPLRQPEMITADQATYLSDSDIVFALEINGDARAYPKRILAWHEMFVDQIGGVDIVGVYCTLCGVVIPYESKIDTTVLDFGTSGFLYRSNKLMYDRQTSSLWNTFTGEPIMGPLAGNGFKLKYRPIVTTRWGDWKRQHPDTKVLSLNTGHQRDYREGIAYRDYFSTDELMFTTPFDDERLDNKQEVLALRFPGAPTEQLAIDNDYLQANPIVNERIGLTEFVILTDRAGANRVYEQGKAQFVSYDRDGRVTDQTGMVWTVEEDRLVSDGGQTLARLPAHRAFWFGWHAAYPETRLIQ